MQIRRREVRLDVSEEYPAVTGIAFADLVDVIEKAIYRHVRAVADAVIESPFGKLAFDQRAHDGIEVMLDVLSFLEAGVYLSPARIRRDKGVKKRNKVSGLKILVEPHEVAFAVQLEMYRVRRAPLVCDARLMAIYEGF